MKTRHYAAPGVEFLEEGDRVLVFLDSGQYMLTPVYIRQIDEEGRIKTHKFPADYPSDGAQSIAADDYAALIRACLAK